MFGMIIAALLLAFGIFLKFTRDPRFVSTKKFSWLLMALGGIAMVGKLILIYQKGEL